MDRENLTNNSCEACHADAPLVTEEEIKELKPKIPAWQILNIRLGHLYTRLLRKLFPIV